MPNADTAHRAGPAARAVSRAWLLGAVLLLIASLAAGYAAHWSGSHLSILTPMHSDSKLQNYTLRSTGDMIYLGTYKDTVIALDTDGRQQWAFPTSGAVIGMELDLQKGWLILGTQGRYLYILDSKDGSLLQQTRVSGVIRSLDYLPEAGLILISQPINAAKGVVSLHDTAGNRLVSLPGRPANGVAFAADGNSFYVADVRANLIRYALDGARMAAVRLDNELYGVAVATNTGDVVAVSRSGTLTRLDADLNQTMQVKLRGEGRSCAVNADASLYAVGTREGDFHLLDADGKTIYATRLDNVVQQIVLDQDAFVVPWNEQLFRLDVTAASSLPLLTAINRWARVAVLVLPVLCVLAFLLAFNRWRAGAHRGVVAVYRHRMAYLMLLPSFALILLFNYYPIAQAFYYAFTDWSFTTRTMREVRFIGIGNFVKMIEDGYFVLGVRNMLRITLFSFLKLLVALLVAELVFSMSGNRRRYWFRFLLVLPMVVPGVVSTLMWKNIYDPSIGLINQLLIALGRPDLTRAWLGNEATALNAIIFMGFPWVNGFAFLVFYGGLISIPGDLFEAARVDGSTPLWNLTRIHLPLILPQIKMILILTFIAAIQDYGGILLLTEGGPGYATYVPGYELYLNATKLGQYGYACALGVVMFVVILGGTVLNMKLKTENVLG